MARDRVAGRVLGARQPIAKQITMTPQRSAKNVRMVPLNRSISPQVGRANLC
jgi:hypothetical protein